MATGTRHVGVVTASRADFGLLAPLIRALDEDSDVRLTLYATGMHFSRRHGETIDEIREHGFGSVLLEVPAAPDNDTPAAMGAAMASGVAGFSKYFEAESPDLLVIMGDRLDVLSAVIANLRYVQPKKLWDYVEESYPSEFREQVNAQLVNTPVLTQIEYLSVYD